MSKTPKPRPKLKCVRCGSNAVDRTDKPGVYVCLNCGHEGTR